MILVRVDVSEGDRVGSKVLKTWSRAVGSGDAVRIREATDLERRACVAAEEAARLRQVIERMKRSGH